MLISGFRRSHLNPADQRSDRRFQQHENDLRNIFSSDLPLRRGIAHELLRALIQRAENEAASSILLEVRESNLPARRLYEKNGFREVGRRRVYYRDPVEDAVLYKLRFDR